jgi:superfamily II DNA/RNA helicase
MPSNVRNDNFDLFKKNEVEIMVCTDIAARGLDLRHVKHVVNLDFPRTKEWYLHRAGRTARAGDKGRVTSIYTKHEKDIAGEIMDEVKDMRRVVNERNQNQSSSQSSTGRGGGAGKRRTSVDGAFGNKVKRVVVKRSGRGVGSKQREVRGDGSNTRGGGALYSNLDQVKRANARRG